MPMELEPGVTTYSAAISTCAKGRQPERVHELLTESVPSLHFAWGGLESDFQLTSGCIFIHIFALITFPHT